MRALPLVSRRWRRLSLSPELLEGFCVSLSLQGEAQPRLLALRAWVQRHAVNLRRLDLDLSPQYIVEESGAGPEAAAHPTPASLLEALLSTVAACGEGGLSELQLSLEGLPPLLPARLASAPLRQLRALRLASSDVKVDVQAPLTPLSRLEDLSLAGLPLLVRAPGALPPTLTSLQLANLERDIWGELPVLRGMPAQVRAACCAASLPAHA